MLLNIPDFGVHLISFLSSCAFVAAIYVKNWIVDSPLYSKDFKLRRELNPHFDFTMHPLEIK